jgi:hypothetical protein
MFTCFPQQLELETAGRFTLTLHSVFATEEHRCGLQGSSRELAYKVCITSAPQYLDDNGFIIDWQVIRVYFAQEYRDLAAFPSCERIALRACRDIVVMLGWRALVVEVTIGSGATAAGVKAVWRQSLERALSPEKPKEYYWPRFEGDVEGDLDWFTESW